MKCYTTTAFVERVFLFSFLFFFQENCFEITFQYFMNYYLPIIPFRIYLALCGNVFKTEAITSVARNFSSISFIIFQTNELMQQIESILPLVLRPHSIKILYVKYYQ